MFHTKFIELLQICKCQFYVSFCFVVTEALNFEESRACMLIFVASMPEMTKIN